MTTSSDDPTLGVFVGLGGFRGGQTSTAGAQRVPKQDLNLAVHAAEVLLREPLQLTPKRLGNSQQQRFALSHRSYPYRVPAFTTG